MPLTPPLRLFVIKTDKAKLCREPPAAKEAISVRQRTSGTHSASHSDEVMVVCGLTTVNGVVKVGAKLSERTTATSAKGR